MSGRRKKKPVEPAGPVYPMSIETFHDVGQYDLSRMSQDEPSCWNGIVRVRRYRVTAELIDEPVEIIHERLLKLWHDCDNWHQWDPLRGVAKEYGLELDIADVGKNKKAAK